MAASIARLAVDLVANTSGFSSTMKKTSKDVDAFGKRFYASAKNVAKLGSIIGGVAAAAGGAFALMTKRALAHVDAQAKLADRLGLTTQALAGLEFAAGQTGVKAEMLHNSLQRMNRRLADAVDGGGPAARIIQKLGLSAEELLKKAPEKAFGEIADRINELGSVGEKTAAAFAFFDTEGGKLLNTMRLGSKGMEDMQRRAEALGVAVSRVDAAKVEAANDAVAEVGTAIGGIWNNVAIRLAPALEGVANIFVDWLEKVGGFKREIDIAFRFVVKSVGSVGQATIDTIETMSRGFQIIGQAGIRIANLFSTAWDTVWEDILLGVAKAKAALGKFLQATASSVRDLLDSIGQGMLSQGVKGAEKVIAAGNKIGAAFGDIGVRYTRELQKLEEQNRTSTADIAIAWDNLFQQFETRSVFGAMGVDFKQRMEMMIADMDQASQLKAEAKTAELEAERAHSEQLAGIEKERVGWLTGIWREGLEERAKFTKMSMGGQVQQVVGSMEEMTRGVAQQNKLMFNINKVAGIANAIINTAQGATKALAAYPPPLSFAMAGLVVAAGTAQIAAIKSASFGGGGSAPSVSGSGGGAASTSGPDNVSDAVGGSGQDIRIVNGGDMALDGFKLLDVLNSALADGGTIRSVSLA